MTPKFLREEAARFRDMAEVADREASKLRYLTMATDFEARAEAAGQPLELAPEPELEPEPARPAEPAPARRRGRASSDAA